VEVQEEQHGGRWQGRQGRGTPVAAKRRRRARSAAGKTSLAATILVVPACELRLGHAARQGGAPGHFTEAWDGLERRREAAAGS
jgi:hypothetical protein